MYQVTLGLQSRLEDENIDVTYSDMITECTNIPKVFQDLIPETELEVICEDIINFSSATSEDVKGNGEPRKSIELIAWLMNKNHMDAQYYRVDFVRHIINEYTKEAKV
jgi:hypothetical protein